MHSYNHKLKILQQQSENLSIPTLEGFEMINLKEVLYLEAENTYTTFFLSDGKKIVATKNIGHYEEELYNDPFIRIHQSYIVNVNKVKRYIKADNGYVVLQNEKVIRVSRSQKEKLLVFFKMSRISNAVRKQPNTDSKTQSLKDS
ncbi:MAG: LytTR family transcriptional regulator [Saprospiraceae bacterium]|jgi:two-component system LytT family response regulator|nr:LytTR family transcriptional regulator [Saprospiraceae bacterium]MCA0334394.1 LytTR family transcriptional regulator [Bacteroidota bacterium]